MARHACGALFLACMVPALLLADLVSEGPEFQVNTYTTGSQDWPVVSMDGAGNFVVVWSSVQDASGRGVFGQRYDHLGNPSGPEFQVNSDPTATSFPSVSMSFTGDFVATWEANYIHARRFGADGTPLGVDFQAASFTGYFVRPSVATMPSGEFVISWADFSNSEDFFIRARRFDGQGVPLGPGFQVNQGPAFYHSSVAADDRGAFTVVWEGADGSLTGIFARRYDPDGAPLGDEFQVNTYITDWQRFPEISVAPSGSFVVVWSSSAGNGSSYTPFGRRYDAAGTPQGGEIQVHVDSAGAYPVAALDDHGNFLVTWGEDEALARHFDGTGSPLGGEIQVNTYTTSGQWSPRVASDGAGRFVVAWTSGNQDGSGEGVFGQRLRCQPFPGAIAGLEVSRDAAGGKLMLTWPTAPDSDAYLVLEDTAPDGAFSTSAASVGIGEPLTAVIPLPADDRYYLIVGRNGDCGLGPRK